MSQGSTYIYKSHHVTVFLYHIVSSKYRRLVFSTEVDKVLLSTCERIELRYGIKFLEIGTAKDHVHFLLQSVASNSIRKIVTTIKSLIVKEISKRCPEVKRQLCGGKFFGKGYFVNTVGQHGTEKKIAEHVKTQGLESAYKNYNPTINCPCSKLNASWALPRGCLLHSFLKAKSTIWWCLQIALNFHNHRTPYLL